LRRAIAMVADGTLQARNPAIWGSATTACASDSKHYSAWDQNLTTQWHVRYGGRGIMIYWHVERNSLCIHSQLKSPSSSEVASMIEGVIHHCTEMEVDRQYVDSHGQSTIAFAFCRLLGFQLLPRLKAIHSQTLYRPETGQAGAYANLQLILSKPIDWELVRQQYDQMVKYTTALRLGTAETEAILRRFTKKNVQHPTYKAFAELGKAIKTIFLCRYLHSEALRREIHEGLNVVEQWNGATDFNHNSSILSILGPPVRGSVRSLPKLAMQRIMSVPVCESEFQEKAQSATDRERLRKRLSERACSLREPITYRSYCPNKSIVPCVVRKFSTSHVG
jgi:TnpA family transposase